MGECIVAIAIALAFIYGGSMKVNLKLSRVGMNMESATIRVCKYIS